MQNNHVNPRVGVKIAGTGCALPEKTVSNRDLERLVETSDEWIRKRTGIRQRRMIDARSESQLTLATDAVHAALTDAGAPAAQLDLVINATVTAETTVPANACRVAHVIGATPAAAYDLVAGCSGFVYAMNTADAMIRSGACRRVAVIGCDVLSRNIDYSDRTVAVIFGDGAAAMILEACADPGIGCIHQTMGADAAEWDALYIPHQTRDIPESDIDNPIGLGCIRMRGREIYRFAVNKFCEVIDAALTDAGVSVDDIAHFVCHQSNARIIEAAAARLGIPMHKVPMNIEDYGNISAGSVPLIFHELKARQKVRDGDLIVFTAFGSGLTWAANVWRV